MQKARYLQILLQFTFGLLALGQYSYSHAEETIKVPPGTVMVLFVYDNGDIQGVSHDGKPFNPCRPCPEADVNEDHSCKVKSVGKLEVCLNLTNVTVTDLEPLAIYHSQGSCYWGYYYRNGYYYYGYICK